MCVFLSALFCDGCSVINTGYDDLLHYSYRRVPDWYDLELSAKFKDGYSLWYYLSLAKIVCCGLSWMLVSFALRLDWSKTLAAMVVDAPTNQRSY